MKERTRIHLPFNTVVLAGGLLHPNFLSPGNLMSMLEQMSETGILALELTPRILAAGLTSPLAPSRACAPQ